MKNLIIFIFLAMLVLSCDEDPAQNNDNSKMDLLPLNTGNYWIYDFWELNSNSQVIDSTFAIDSLVVVENISIYDRQAFYLNLYRNSKLIDHLIISKDDWGISRLLDSNFALLQGRETYWMKIYSSVTSEWDILTKYSENQDFEFKNSIYPAAKHYIYKGAKSKSPDYLTIGDFVYSSLANNIKMDRKFSFKYKDSTYPKSATIDEVQLNYERYWFVKNIGLSKWQFDPYQTITKSDSTYCEFNSNPVTIYHKGWLRHLKRYKIN